MSELETKLQFLANACPNVDRMVLQDTLKWVGVRWSGGQGWWAGGQGLISRWSGVVGGW